MNCLCTGARLALLQQRLDRLERRLQVVLAQSGIDLRDFTVVFCSGNAYSFTVAGQDMPALTDLIHSVNEIALMLGCAETVSIQSPPFAAAMASDGRDWRGLITYSNWTKPLAFASRTDLQDLRQAIAEKASAKDL